MISFAFFKFPVYPTSHPNKNTEYFLDSSVNMLDLIVVATI